MRAPVAGRCIPNALSVDVEGFLEANVECLPIDPRRIDKAQERREVEQNMDATLALFSEAGVRGTFFILGRIAREVPHIVRQIADAGHEIGCHGDQHRRIFNLNSAQFRQQLCAAKSRLEDVAGRPVHGFRAPDFSITRASLWALDVIQECGFTYDSSIYPIGAHDVYGIRTAPPFIHELPNGLVEFPPSTVRCLRTRVPFGGGGYFRFYPILVTSLCIARMNRRGHPCMFYIHPYEVGPRIPEVPGLSYYRRLRHYYNCANGGARLRKILSRFRFAPAIDVLREAYPAPTASVPSPETGTSRGCWSQPPERCPEAGTRP